MSKHFKSRIGLRSILGLDQTGGGGQSAASQCGRKDNNNSLHLLITHAMPDANAAHSFLLGQQVVTILQVSHDESRPGLQRHLAI